MKKSIKIISIILVTFLIFGCGKSTKVFKEDDFKITLTSEFNKSELEGFTYYYESINALVTVLKEEKSSLEPFGINDSSSAEDYVKLVISANDKDSEYELRNDYAYFEYEATVDEEDFYYLTATYKSDDAFWILNFISTKEDKDKFKNEFLKWADSVEV